MNNTTVLKLDTKEDWLSLQENIDPKFTPAVSGVLSHLKKLKASSIIIENEYLDRDYGALFSEFYATTFKRHSKLCRRIHFLILTLLIVSKKKNIN